MNQQELKKTARKFSLTLLITMIFTQFIFNGCGDSNITGVNSNSSNTISGSGERSELIQPDSTSILLNMSLRFKSQTLNESKVLESNEGNRFNHIVSIDRELKPSEELDLQELQPYGIFSLYLCGTGSFALSNSDGMNFGAKTILFEKCSFIDIKVRNTEIKSIHISGFIAGE